MKKVLSRFGLWMQSGSLLFLLLLTSCGAPSRSDVAAVAPVTGTFSGGGSKLPAKISLTTDKSTVKSDNSDKATLTVSVLDANNSPVEGTDVTFTSTGGQISTTKVTTDASGQATTIFSSGIIDKSNQTVTITAAVFGVTPVQIPIQIIGSTITLSADNTNITSDGATKAMLTVSVKDAGNANVFNAPVSLTVSGTGSATVSPASGNTNASGQITVTVTGVSAGSVTVTATSLGATATQEFTVSTPLGAFGIKSPTADPASLGTGSPLTVTVNAPSSSNVVFATTIGVWDGATSIVTKPVAGGVVSAVLTSTTAGVANVMVYDASVPAVNDSLKVAISAPSSAASSLSLQSNVNVLSPSLGALSYTATLTATVVTSGNQVVGGAPVAFSIVNPTGGGETVSPVVVYTSSSGVATATFTSGTRSSGGSGVTIKAEVVGTAISNTVNIVIGGTAGSLVIGQSTQLSENGAKTTYSMPMSVLVADSNGSPVPNASITLSLWPLQYATDGSVDNIVGVFNNEDINENTTLDPGEDKNGDLEITPPNSAAGALPSTVTTDASGVANFSLTYLKQSSRFIKVRLTASTLVLGTETKSTLVFVLPATKADITAGVLPNSPYKAPVTGVPLTISLSGIAGATVTSAALSPTFGNGTYIFSADLGVMAPVVPGVSSTYSYTIPGGTASGTVITDTIYITDTSVPPAQVSVSVTITVL